MRLRCVFPFFVSWWNCFPFGQPHARPESTSAFIVGFPPRAEAIQHPFQTCVYADLPNAEVTESEQETSAARMGLASSARVSAKTGQGVDKAFERLILRVYEVEHGRGQPTPPPKEAPPRGIVLANSKPPVQEEKLDCC